MAIDTLPFDDCVRLQGLGYEGAWPQPVYFGLTARPMIVDGPKSLHGQPWVPAPSVLQAIGWISNTFEFGWDADSPEDWHLIDEAAADYSGNPREWPRFSTPSELARAMLVEAERIRHAEQVEASASIPS